MWLNQDGKVVKTWGWNVAETLLHMPASEFLNAHEEEQIRVVEAIDTVQLYDAVVKIAECNGETQVRLQKLTACAAEVDEADLVDSEPEEAQGSSSEKRAKKAAK